MKNFLNQQFYIGQFVAYSVRKGSSMWMSVGIVYSVPECSKNIRVITVRLGNKENKNKSTEAYDFQLLERGWDYCKDLIFKKVSVDPYRMVVVDRDFLPFEIVQGLEKEIVHYLPINKVIE